MCCSVCCSALQCVVICRRVLILLFSHYVYRLWCNVLHIEVYCSILQYVAVCCSMLQYVAVCCSHLEDVAVHMSCVMTFFQKEFLESDVRSRKCVLQYVAVCCSMLQYVAVCCSTMPLCMLCKIVYLIGGAPFMDMS